MERSNNEKTKQEARGKAEAILLGYEKTIGKIFRDRNEARRIISRMLESKVIQGTLDQIGDKIVNNWVQKTVANKAFPVDPIEMESFLKSNFYLNKVYADAKFPLEATAFINESFIRYSKRNASLLEWTIGFIFLIFKRDGVNRSREICNEILEELFMELKPGKEKELQTSLSEYQKEDPRRLLARTVVLNILNTNEWKRPSDIAYEASKRIGRQFPLASVFLHLEMLEDGGYVESIDKGDHKVFRLTAAGEKKRAPQA
jgi:hypothetical protein